MRHLNIVTVLILGALLLAGCGGETAPDAAPEAAPAPVEAPPALATTFADLQAREGFTVTGRVDFEQPGDGGTVLITASIQGAPPGTHGLHIHETGDCSAADFTSAGGHFNPTGDPHGGPQDPIRHSGDLGNIEIGDDGSGTLRLESDLITLAPVAPTSILGKAVILHEGADDLVSQPTGAAGGRIACGVIAN